MTKYKVYNKLHYGGKPRGRAYLNMVVEAKSIKDAIKKGQNDNKYWNNLKENRQENVRAVAVKAVKVTKKKSTPKRHPFMFNI